MDKLERKAKEVLADPSVIDSMQTQAIIDIGKALDPWHSTGERKASAMRSMASALIAISLQLDLLIEGE